MRAIIDPFFYLCEFRINNKTRREEMNKLQIKNLKLGDIHAYKNNAKKHPESQVQQIISSITKFGFNNPILIDENNEIIAGHGRFMAAQVMNLETVPTVKLSHLTDAQKRAYRLADNKIAENGGWNKELLSLEIKDLEKICLNDNFVIQDIGFNDAELDSIVNFTDTKPINPKTNAVPFIPEDEIISKPGDIWQLSKHRIICGDSLNPETFAKLFENDKADMILQDPPYNVKIDGHVCGSGIIKHKEFAMASGEMTADEFTQFLMNNFALCKQYSNNGSLHYNFMDWRHVLEITTAGKNIFDKFINMCVWVKTSGCMGSLYRSQHELCFIFQNGKGSHNNNVQLGKYGRYRTNVWQYAGVNTFGKHKQDGIMHPTVKPIEMLKDAILDVSKRGDIVLDSFLGSGSTLIACQQSGRICYGIEYEPLYIDTTIRRFQNLFGIDAINLSIDKTYNEILKEHKGGNNV